MAYLVDIVGPSLITVVSASLDSAYLKSTLTDISTRTDDGSSPTYLRKLEEAQGRPYCSSHCIVSELCLGPEKSGLFSAKCAVILIEGLVTVMCIVYTSTLYIARKASLDI